VNEHRVAICMPSARPIPSEVVDSFARLYGRGLVEGYVTAELILGDTYLDAARNLLTTYAMDLPTNPTHAFWFDDDMTMPSDTIARLLAHDVPIVGGLYHQRAAPFMPVAYNFTGEGHSAQMIELPDEPTGLVQVDGLGFGCTLIQMNIYLEMAEHFGDPRWHQVNEGVGEDVFFFRRVKEMGIPVWLDCDVRAGHVRRETVTTTHYQAYRTAHPRPDPEVSQPAPV